MKRRYAPIKETTNRNLSDPDHFVHPQRLSGTVLVFSANSSSIEYICPPLAYAMVWREPRDHHKDCYFCVPPPLQLPGIKWSKMELRLLGTTIDNINLNRYWQESQKAEEMYAKLRSCTSEKPSSHRHQIPILSKIGFGGNLKKTYDRIINELRIQSGITQKERKKIHCYELPSYLRTLESNLLPFNADLTV
ncbi:unnamed protein product [Clavelina lepadiformis]|uniref:Uncharacterized protein n=1 Tax=Clavelina lepadiformis TaxID=159417 RepID=A0ABP0GEC9_CLALP